MVSCDILSAVFKNVHEDANNKVRADMNDKVRTETGAEEVAPRGCPLSEERPAYVSDKLAAIIVAFDGGDLQMVIRLFDEACEERFDAGMEYAKDTVDEWRRG